MKSTPGEGGVAIGSEVGMVAPEIDLPDERHQRWRLSEARGRIVVLLFYPADETPVCTKQLCAVRDNWTRYEELGAEVVGINSYSVEDHARFIEIHQLPLRLLSDPEGEVIRAYGMRSLIGTRRGVVVIDREGRIRYRRVVLPIFRPDEDETLKAIEACR